MFLNKQTGFKGFCTKLKQCITDFNGFTRRPDIVLYGYKFLGFIFKPCYIQYCVIMNRAIKSFICNTNCPTYNDYAIFMIDRLALW